MKKGRKVGRKKRAREREKGEREERRKFGVYEVLN